MHLRSLELTNFRNLRQVQLQLDPGPTLLVGDNGQGKTNLLEAAELLGTAKSSRASSDRELVNWKALQSEAPALPEAFARIRATVLRDAREIKAEIIVRAEVADSPPTRGGVSKVFRLNGLPKRALEFVGAINTVAFSPLDVSLVDGPPSGRRRYLDVMNCQASSRYLHSLQRFQKLLVQRNHLLHEFRGRPPREADDASLGVWTHQLTSEAAFLVLERARSIHDLTSLADHWFHELRGSGGLLEIRYHPSVPLDGLSRSDPRPPSDADVADLQALMEEAYRRVRNREVGAGITLLGPHRDDLHFLLDGVDLNVYGSRGQQRLAALALKLAEADLLERRVGSRPILLMDDVLSELDTSRQAAVLGFIAEQGQTLLTSASTDILQRPEVRNMAVLQVENGAVSAFVGEAPSI